MSVVGREDDVLDLTLENSSSESIDRDAKSGVEPCHIEILSDSESERSYAAHSHPNGAPQGTAPGPTIAEFDCQPPERMAGHNMHDPERMQEGVPVTMPDILLNHPTRPRTPQSRKHDDGGLVGPDEGGPRCSQGHSSPPSAHVAQHSGSAQCGPPEFPAPHEAATPNAPQPAGMPGCQQSGFNPRDAEMPLASTGGRNSPSRSPPPAAFAAVGGVLQAGPSLGAGRAGNGAPPPRRLEPRGPASASVIGLGQLRPRRTAKVKRPYSPPGPDVPQWASNKWKRAKAEAEGLAAGGGDAEPASEPSPGGNPMYGVRLDGDKMFMEVSDFEMDILNTVRHSPTTMDRLNAMLGAGTVEAIAAVSNGNGVRQILYLDEQPAIPLDVDNRGSHAASDSGETIPVSRRRKSSGSRRTSGGRRPRKPLHPTWIPPAQQPHVDPPGIRMASAGPRLETLLQGQVPPISDEGQCRVIHAFSWFQLICVECNPRASNRDAMRVGLGVFALMCLQHARMKLAGGPSGN